jgi:tripartite-type tricarboxylate transporter receptor subunit TctC
MTLQRRTLLACLPAFASPATVFAQAAAPYPNRPVRIVPFGTGGGPIDTLARAYGEKLSQRWGQPIVVDPKPGASGIIAADFVAKAAADGYTVMMTMPLTHVNNAILMKLPYDPIKDFTPLSMLATGGPMLVARADAPFNDVREFVAYAKRQSKPLSYGTWGNGSAAHLFGELLKRQSGADLMHVPYKSEAAAHIDLFGQLLDFAWANPSTARTHVQAGKMKVLAIAGSRRVSVMPQVSTFHEQGLSGFDVDSWIGIYAPANLPPELQNTLVTALRDITQLPDIQARLTAFGFEPLANTPAQFSEVLRADYPRVSALIKAAGVTAP